MVISLTFTFRFTHRALSRRLRSDVMSCEGVMLCGVEGKFEQVNLESFDSLQGSMVLTERRCFFGEQLRYVGCV